VTVIAHEFDERTDSTSDRNASQEALQKSIVHAAHLLPSQGPITVFVHHNTLHAFEHLDFDTGVQTGGRLYGCHAYLPEEDYRNLLSVGRIRVEDLDAVLQEDLGDEADRLVASFGTRYALRLAMLQFPLHSGSTHELRWVVAESDALRRFRSEVAPEVRKAMTAETRDQLLQSGSGSSRFDDVHADLMAEFDNRAPDDWSDSVWESFVLNDLWRVCCDGLRRVGDLTEQAHAAAATGPRHRDVLFEATGKDSDLLVHDTLIRFCAPYLDQGFADWELPHRHSGLYRSFLAHHAHPCGAVSRWSSTIRNEALRLQREQRSPLDSIEESLQVLGIDESERESFITQSLLALRGWAGMIWQMETNAEWAPYPAPAGSLVEFLAVRLMLDRLALEFFARDSPELERSIGELRRRSRPQPDANHLEQRAFIVFQLAQVRGWKPRDLQNLSHTQWRTLVSEIEAFHSLERRRIYHRAFERKYRNATLDAVIAHNSKGQGSDAAAPDDEPMFQLVTCIDDREESFRRHLEEICPDCETFGIAGFYGTAMYYRGLGHAHYKPLCPVSIKPTHYVIEEPVYSQAELERHRSAARRRLGQLRHQAHLGTRSFFGGILTAIGGSLAAFPLVGRVLFPRATARLHSWLGRIVESRATQLRIERTDDGTNDATDSSGFSIEEMTAIVESVLLSSGLSRRWAKLVLFLGHGSSSLNNPHESAYNCGACAGSQGGPNARAFALMANDHRVRARLADRGLVIPETTVFVGGYHDTTNESVTFFDLDRLPVSQRARFESTLEIVNEARRRNAHERCRRFETAPLSFTTEEALRHVEERPEDLSQARPEYNHATNALCFVGRRNWSRGLFLDRRAFLTSYDPSLDDNSGTILEEILRAAIPVCAGISLEYYFSTIDTEGYGCGSKLPHNITSLLGVMAGAASDLRPGLSEQMVEIHEPMRILFVIETNRDIITRIIDNNESIARLVRGDWVQLAIFDPATNHIHRYVRGEFVLYAPHDREIPTVESSLDWYRGRRDHLGFASIVPAAANGKEAPL